MIYHELHSLVAQTSAPDLQLIVQHLGESCLIRQPLFPREEVAEKSAVFANPKRFADEIEYGEGLEGVALLIPLGGDAPLAQDLEPQNAVSMEVEPMKALILQVIPEERAVVTVMRNKVEKHYYVLQRSLLTQEEPRIVQCFLIPMNVDGLLDSTPDEPQEPEILLTEG